MWGGAAALETLARAEAEAQKETFLELPFVAPSSSALVPNEPTRQRTRQMAMTSLASQSQLSLRAGGLHR